MKIPFVDLKAQYLSIKQDIDKAIATVIDETCFINGHFVKEFERDFASLYGAKHVIGCANGTDALYILMKMMGVGQGHEVITVANSWISSSETISQTGARPVFVDVHPDYYSLDETQLEKKINKNTKGVIAVHLQGQACEIGVIKAICDKHGLFLIEDCAQSHFTEYKGKRAGLIGTAGSFSFYPGKNLGAYGDAGGIMTNDDALAERCRMFANHGALKKPDHRIEGINSRLDTIQAAILSAKLPNILRWTEQRIRNAALYDRYLADIPQLVTPKVRPETKHSYHLYVVRAQQRDELMSFLKDAGVETAIHYPVALPNLPAYKYLGHTPADFPVATRLQQEILSLPMYPELTEEGIAYVAGKIRAFYKR
ncbi:MAG: DegT/DnrJ/EryC1/StrS family aminotransferase [Bacteroidetes bacterium]|nr:DegT/DnrJ/EryC1/StrS family aminotransferase [Bacteroidota bacterium]